MWLVVKLWLTWGRYLNQDEFETLHQAWLISQGAVPYRDFRSNHPPFAFEWLSWLYCLTSDAVWIIRLARFATVVSAGIVLALLYRIGRDVYGEAAGRWAVIVYSVNATFWEWSTEIRTDFLLVPLWLTGVCLMFSPRPIATRWRMVWTGLVMGTAFWVNQKAVFHAVPLAVLMLSGGPQRTWRYRDVMLAVAASLLPVMFVIGRAYANRSLPDLIQNNFVGSCAWGLVETDYYRAWRIVTLRRLVVHDAGFVVLAVVACLWGIRGERSRSQCFITLSAVWMLLTLFLTPAPFAYYLLSVLPLFAVATGGFLAARLGPNRFTLGDTTLQRLSTGAAIACFLAFPLMRMTKFVSPTNRYQLEVLRLAQDLTSSQTRVFDGAGTMLTRPDAYPFHWVLWQPELAAYRAGKLPPLVPTLRKNDCRLLIDTYRVHALQPADRRQLQTQFVRLWGPLRVPGYDSIDAIGENPREFELWYDGEYVASQPDVLVDGEPMSQPRRLTAGRHQISLSKGRARVTLRLRQIPKDMELPREEGDPGEFLGKYGYGY